LRPRRLTWLAILALLLMAGCRALPPAPPPVAVASPEELLSRLQSRHRTIQSFQAKGRITVLAPQQNYSGTALLKGILPATLRVDVLDFFGRTILSFATDGSQVQVLSPREGKFFHGPATPRNLAAFIPPAVTLPQAVRLLAGALPLSPGVADRSEYDPGKGQYLMEWRGEGGTLQERLWVAAQGLAPAEEVWYGQAPEPRFSAQFSDFGALVPDLPEKLTLKTTTPKIELRLVYTELRLNPPLNAADLVLQPPPGVAVVPLRP
jgi:hypothetical protein